MCAIAWMKDAAQAAFDGFTYQGLTDYKLFKEVIFDGAEATNYQIDMTAEIVDNGLVVETKISSINVQEKKLSFIMAHNSR